MEIKIIQHQVGQFNFLGNEKSLSFSMAIIKEGKVIEENGVKAMIHYSGEPDEYDDFDNAIENLSDVFEKCYGYSSKVVSSTNYAANCRLFVRIYTENYETLDNNFVAKKKERIEKQIAKLQSELSQNTILPELYEIANYLTQQEIKKYEGWLASEADKMNQLKEGSDLYEKAAVQVRKYSDRIAALQTQLIPEPTNQ